MGVTRRVGWRRPGPSLVGLALLGRNLCPYTARFGKHVPPGAGQPQATHPQGQVGVVQVRSTREQDADDVAHVFGLCAQVKVLQLVEDQVLGRMDVDPSQRRAKIHPDSSSQGGFAQRIAWTEWEQFGLEAGLQVIANDRHVAPGLLDLAEHHINRDKDGAFLEFAGERADAFKFQRYDKVHIQRGSRFAPCRSSQGPTHQIRYPGRLQGIDDQAGKLKNGGGLRGLTFGSSDGAPPAARRPDSVPAGLHVDPRRPEPARRV